ncbi:MAG TPA: DUF5825 family protein [Streptomyces sp.]|uniref:DUF5825 family protein n=1 Tax=Streptomyces sp. TaxID=1931 RepID=UPI002B5F9539|nr:DUF5825 family protein [Streptomyces sp.]HWU09900.1 DUF5825 family protein [Streptomyces sp.]
MPTTNDAVTVPGDGSDVRFSMWRHGDATVRAMPGMHLGDRVLGGDVADEAHRIHRTGARFVSVEPLVDLGGRAGTEHVIPALSFIRELTSYGVEVNWRAKMTAPDGPEWWVFSHLFPPSVLEGPRGAEALALWRARYHVGRCFFRRGPGFLQIRDRRHAGLRRLTVPDGAYVSAVESLLAGHGADSVSAAVMSVFEKHHLAVRIGGGVWWAPYRLRRWASPSWEV